MSQRNASSNKAVKDAWANERALVAQGKGTRDWTPQQQVDILTKGKAYDENGRAFEGHHMKNVKHYPEHQGKWQNIQFLSRKEHRQAHNNNFRNKTNGMYDFKTGKTKDFGNKGYERPSEINLSNKVSANEIAATKSRLSAEKSRNKSISAEKISSGRTAAAKSAGISAKTPAGHAPGISQGASRGGVSHSGKGTGHGR